MDRHLKSSKITKWLLIFVNIPGIALFLYFASKIWAPAADKGLYGGPGDPIIWTFLAFPFLAICTLVNFIASRGVLIRFFYHRDWRLFALYIVIIAAWIGAVKYDFSRPYDGSRLSQENSNAP